MTTARIEALIRKLVERYQRDLGLGEVSLHLVFEPHENREEDGIANTNGDPHYREAWISFDVDAIMAEADRRLEAGGLCCRLLFYERLVRHELAHAGTWRFLRTAEAAAGKRKALQRIITDEFESLATWIELLPVWKHRCARRL